jgi:cytosine/adenosine deaminase-related metal-dependent hydrolase
VLGREDIGSLEPGKSADFAIWDDEWLFSGAEDRVAALVFGGPTAVAGLVVRGRHVLENVVEDEIVREHCKAAARFEG